MPQLTYTVWDGSSVKDITYYEQSNVAGKEGHRLRIVIICILSFHNKMTVPAFQHGNFARICYQQTALSISNQASIWIKVQKWLVISNVSIIGCPIWDTSQGPNFQRITNASPWKLRPIWGVLNWARKNECTWKTPGILEHWGSYVFLHALPSEMRDRRNSQDHTQWGLQPASTS